MKNIFKIAVRNLLRYKRRTLLTALLITVGVVMAIVLSGVTSSFKEMMIGTITDTTIGHLQVHKRGYVNSIDVLPLDLNLDNNESAEIRKILEGNDDISVFTFRMRFGAILSNYNQTSQVILNAIYPETENQTCPGLSKNIKGIHPDPSAFVQPGEIIVPENIAKGLSLNLNDSLVLLASNQEGSINGINLIISGFVSGTMGPSKNGYIHIEDAKTLLRMESAEINEIAIRLKRFDQLEKTFEKLNTQLSKRGNIDLEVHTWDQISPFSTIDRIINFFVVVVKLILILIVLISILNVMIMSVYERIREIGTIAAIGTLPSKIIALFLVEGLALAVLGVFLGNIIGLGIVGILNLVKIQFAFGVVKGLVLAPAVSLTEVIVVSFIVILVSVIASLQPAIKASRLEPVDALRHI